MPSSDKRLEVLEDELKLLKGEVKRTLVDLRAFVMREDSPLNDRLTMGPAPAPVAQERNAAADPRMAVMEEELRVLRQQKAEPSDPTPSAPPSNHGDIAMAMLQDQLKAQSTSPTGQNDKAMDILQEQLKAQMSERANFIPNAQTPPQGDPPQTAQVATESRPAVQETSSPSSQSHENTVEQDPPKEQLRRRTQPDAEERRRPEDDQRPPKEVRTRRRKSDYPHDGSTNGRPQEYAEEAYPDEPRREGAETDYFDPSERGRYQEMRAQSPYESNGNGHHRDYAYIEEEYYPDAPPEDVGPPREAGKGRDTLDVNMISNLVRWAIQAKRRVGHDRLMDLLELYLCSGHHSRELKEIISYICNVVEEEPLDYEPDPAHESVDLIHQLHGILFSAVLGTTSAQGSSLTEAADMRIGQVTGALSIGSTSAIDSGNGTNITVTGDNTGAMSYGNFSQVDVLTKYTDTTGDQVAKRLAYVCKQLCGDPGDPGDNQWTITGINPDSYNPKMWDPDETLTIVLRVAPKVKTGTSGTAAVGAPGGVSDSAYFKN